MTERNPFVLGVWLEYSPAETQSGQGISRLTGWLLRSLAERPDVRIVLATAKWSEKDIRELLKENQVPLDRVAIVTSRKRVPLALQFQEWLQTRARRRRPKKKTWWRRIFRRLLLNPVVRAVAQPILTTDNFFLAAFLVLLLLLLSPVILLAALLFALIWKLFNNRITRKPYTVARQAVEKSSQDWRTFKDRHWYGHLAAMARAMRDQEFRLLAEKAARRSDVKLWYSPHPFATHITAVRKPVVVAVPDLVYVDFFNAFDADWSRQVDQKIRALVSHAEATISFCEDVRERHVVKHLGVNRGRARMIRHGAIDAAADLEKQANPAVYGAAMATQTAIRTFILNKGDLLTWNSRIPLFYLRDFPFEEVPFLFVSSQIRPNKNYLNLFRAYEFLLRRRRRNLKLIMTGSLELENYGLRSFINQRALDLDILSIPAMPADVHAAFYQLAALTVVPSLFEGGFPFQLTESLSLNTPVVMSDIAVTREVLPEPLWQRTLFDGTDPMAIADCIEWALDHGAALLEMQKPFYERLRRRTWDVVAEEYLDVFREVAGASR